eukprot:gnl/TRDRNA2_/TRDRNA2_181661_c0_seq1.p1 gnl/TRDRNA2_/TRDRNA2_181661_c0~~gnl/TRDRNA2_/TRDRNA2_181661_c0_seq1.p1  ORF type:complete len:169 (+),score=8.90 gnl/TRDRNA2_/TRDRNA2_181661_c0_seq1:83-589(+)
MEPTKSQKNFADLLAFVKRQNAGDREVMGYQAHEIESRWGTVCRTTSDAATQVADSARKLVSSAKEASGATCTRCQRRNKQTESGREYAPREKLPKCDDGRPQANPRLQTTGTRSTEYTPAMRRAVTRAAGHPESDDCGKGPGNMRYGIVRGMKDYVAWGKTPQTMRR